jgi:hypothetical protein
MEKTMSTGEQVHESVDEFVATLKPTGMSLTEALKVKKPSINYSRKKIDVPQVSDSGRRSISDVGNYLIQPAIPVGIDLIEVSFTFIDFIADNPKDWEKGPKHVSVNRRYGKWINSFSINPEFPKADLYFQAEVSETYRRGKLWFNPSTVLFGPKSLYIAGVDETQILLNYAYEIVQKWLYIKQPLESFRLKRLHVTCDVDRVADTERLLKMAAHFPHNNRVDVITHSKGWFKRQSVTARSDTNGGFIVYNKTRQSKKGDAVVRFETNAKGKPLEKHCPTVSDLTQDTANDIFKHYFHKMMTGLSQTTETPLEGVLSDPGHKKRVVELVGIKALKRAGFHPEISDAQQRGFRILERMGIGNAIEAMLYNME